jgi:hypothetical protein
MAEYLRKNRIDKEDWEKVLPTMLKYFPATTRFYLNDLKMRLTLVLDWDLREKFKETVTATYGSFTPENVNKAVTEAMNRWIEEKKQKQAVVTATAEAREKTEGVA